MSDRDGCFTTLIVGLIISWVGSLFLGWMFMLAVGIVHHEWWPAVPTIGYWWSVLLVALLRSVFGSYSPGSKSD